MAGQSYIRRDLGAGEVEFIVSPIPSGTLVIPAGAAVLFIYAASVVVPWLPAVIAVGVGGVLFYWLRIRIKQPNEATSTVLIASPTGLIIGDRTVPRARIQKVTWTDYSRPSDSLPGHYWDSSVGVETVSGEGIHLAGRMNDRVSRQLASELGRVLGDVPVSGEYPYRPAASPS